MATQAEQTVLDAAVAYALAEKKVYELSCGNREQLHMAYAQANAYGRDWICGISDKISQEQLAASRHTAEAALLIAKSKLCSAVRELQNQTKERV